MAGTLFRAQGVWGSRNRKARRATRSFLQGTIPCTFLTAWRDPTCRESFFARDLPGPTRPRIPRLRRAEHRPHTAALGNRVLSSLAHRGAPTLPAARAL